MRWAWTQSSGMGAAWHCEQVVVNNETTGRSYAFACDRWLAKDKEDGQTRVRLKAMSDADGTTSYRVVVYTSDMRGAGAAALQRQWRRKHTQSRAQAHDHSQPRCLAQSPPHTC